MRKIFVSALVLVCLMAVSASAFSGHEAWKLKLDSPLTSGIAVSEGALFFGLESGTACAVNVNTGRIIWEVAGDNSVYGMPSVVRDMVIFARGDGEVIALKASDGSFVWATGGLGGRDIRGRAVNDGLSDGTSAGGGMVYVSKADSKVHAYRDSDGRTAWTYTTSDQGVRSAPTYSDGLVFVGEYDGIFSIIDAKTGRRLNGGGAGGAVNTPAAANGNVYFSSWDGSVNAVKIKGVIPLWNANVRDAITTQPEVSGGKIVVGTGRGTIVALDEKTGRILWRFNTNGGNISAKPVIADGLVFAGAESGAVYALDLATGRPAGTLSDANGLNSTPAYSGGLLFFGSGNNLYAVR
ncbi:MAG: PQQ-binding-like beta-propeller repeat protein [Synergistaceae bacterium]|nr:PQQ-binding-like beta-propeller repeat protein [Synergistaceae bacterium]